MGDDTGKPLQALLAYIKAIADGAGRYLTRSAAARLMAVRRFGPIGLEEGSTAAEISLFFQDAFLKLFDEELSVRMKDVRIDSRKNFKREEDVIAAIALAALKSFTGFMGLMPEIAFPPGKPPQPRLNWEVFNSLCVKAGWGVKKSNSFLAERLGVSRDTIRRARHGEGLNDETFETITAAFSRIHNRLITEDLRVY